MLHQVGDLFELNVKLRCQKVKSQKSGHVLENFRTAFSPSTSVPVINAAFLNITLFSLLGLHQSLSSSIFTAVITPYNRILGSDLIVKGAFRILRILIIL